MILSNRSSTAPIWTQLKIWYFKKSRVFSGALFFGIFTIVTLALVYYDDVPSMWKFPLMSLAVILCAIAFGFVARWSLIKKFYFFFDAVLIIWGKASNFSWHNFSLYSITFVPADLKIYVKRRLFLCWSLETLSDCLNWKTGKTCHFPLFLN